eukprot:GEMP01032275.1.p1 GENE.GEMP01032275.1~~GEMP01032275.1.p1  ORF type:complete len:326 (+),score=67.05 GEMP01032275.1:64-1041(+)
MLLIVASCVLPTVSGHGWMVTPPGRNYIASTKHQNMHNAMRVPGSTGNGVLEYNPTNFAAPELDMTRDMRGTNDWTMPSCGNGHLPPPNDGTLTFYEKTAIKDFPVYEMGIPAGQPMDAGFKVTANHVGRFFVEFACADGYEDKTSQELPNSAWQRLKMLTEPAEGETTRYCHKVGGLCTLSVMAPTQSCNHGIVQMNWLAEHLGNKYEHYRNCADVKIIGGSPGGSTGTGTGARPPSVTVTQRPVVTKKPVVDPVEQRCKDNGCLKHCDAMTRSASTSDTGMSTGALVGAVIGGVALVGLLTGFAWRAHTRTSSERRISEPAKE